MEKNKKTKAPAETTTAPAPEVMPDEATTPTPAFQQLQAQTALVAAAATGIVASGDDVLAGIVRVGDDGYADVDMDQAEQIGDRVAGNFEGSYWVPFMTSEFSDLKESVLAEKIGKLGGPAVFRRNLSGTLVASMAWGRRAYFLDVGRVDAQGLKSIERVKLPEHHGLYAGLNLIALGAPVVLRFDGLGKAKDAKQPPKLYTVIALKKGMTGTRPRRDAIRLLSIEERKAMDEKRKAREAAELAAEVNGDDADTGMLGPDEDLPF